MNAKKIAKTNRLLADLGHANVIDALEHAKLMRGALRVISIWALEPWSLNAMHVRELCDEALNVTKSEEEK